MTLEQTISSAITNQLFGEKSNSKRNISARFVGRDVIIRSDRAGVFFGIVDEVEGDTVILTNAIRIWKWAGAASLSQMAMEGVKEPEECNFAVPVNEICLQFIEIIPCNVEASKNIRAVKSWKV